MKLLALLPVLAIVLVAGCIGQTIVPPGGQQAVQNQTQNVTQAAASAIKIGAIFPLVGDIATIGAPASQGAELAVEEINEAGGIDGRRIELILEDGRCTPKDATTAAQKLIDVDKVIAIVGGLCSGETLAAAPIAEAAKVVLFSPTSSNPRITEAGDYIFRNYPSDAFQGKIAAEYADSQGARKAAIIFINNDWANGIVPVFESRFKELGGTIVAKETFDQGASDLRTQLTKIKNSNPDFVYFVSHPKETVIGLKQRTELGITTPFFGGDAADDPTIANESGASSEGFKWLVPAANPPADFAAKFKAKTGKEPSVGVPQAYDIVKILAWAIDDVGPDPAKIKDKLYTLKDYPGVTGPTSLDSNGDLTTAIYHLREIVNGTMVTIATI